MRQGTASTPIRRRIRVFLADGHALVRGGIRATLEAEPDISVVGEATAGPAAVDEVIRLRPDVAIVDAHLSELDGTEVLLRIGARAPQTRVITLATTCGDDHVLAFLRAGAAGFLVKDVAPEALVEAIRTAAAGESPLAPGVIRRLIDELILLPQPDPHLREAVERLTEREREVMQLIARGMTNADIARRLYLSEGTVKTHVTNIFAKLGLGNRAQVVVAAYETGVVRLGQPVTNPAEPEGNTALRLATA